MGAEYYSIVRKFAESANYKGWAYADLMVEVAYCWTEIQYLGIRSSDEDAPLAQQWLMAEWEGKLQALYCELDRLERRGLSRNGDVDVTDGWTLIEDAKMVHIGDLIRRLGREVKHNKFACLHPGHEDDSPSAHVYWRTNSYYCHVCCKGGTGIDLVRNAGLAKTSIEAAKWILGEV